MADHADQKDKHLSLGDKLRMIDQEIRTLQSFCVSQGYNPLQIEQCADPLLGLIKAVKRRRLLAWGAKVALVLALLVALFYYDPAYRLFCAYGRLAAIQVLPYWDWTRIHDKQCLLDNPYYVANQLLEEDCELCEHLERIDRVQNVSHSVFAEDYLKRDIPVIITDGTDGWKAKELFSVPFLNELYLTEGDLKDRLPCMFASNVRVKYGNPRALLSRAAQGDITNWYAHWENCNKAAAKVIRQFYTRPYFIPPMVEMAQPNWILLASHYTGKRNKPADIALPMMWIAQLKGQIKVTLTPRPPCDKSCAVLYNTLHEGDILIVTDMMWLLDYIPVSQGDTIAIGSGGYFD